MYIYYLSDIRVIILQENLCVSHKESKVRRIKIATNDGELLAVVCRNDGFHYYTWGHPLC